MTLQARTVLNLIAGAIGGLLAWIVIDLTGWFTLVTVKATTVTAWSWPFWLQLILGGVLGAFISLMLGIVDALSVDSAQQRLRALSIHSVVGFFGGAVGIWIGQTVWAVLAPHSRDINNPTPPEFVQALIAHAIGWSLVGVGVGLAQGVARQSVALIKQGAFGGFVGGLVGGILFQSAASVVQNGTPARLLGFTCIGAATGFFIGLIQTLFRQAWVKVVLGRNEGKEYLIDKPVTVIGRSELADIGLFGNGKIMPHHCAIEQVQDRFRLQVIPAEDNVRKGMVPANVKVNGLVVNPDVWLSNGDSIQIDDRTLTFHERLSRRTSPPAPVQKAAISPAPASQSATVKVLEGTEVGRTFEIGIQAAQIGRTEESSIFLAGDTLISRKHATIQLSEGQWSLTDCGSANGTYVNRTRLDPDATIKLRSGDQIRVGGTVLRFTV